MAGVGWGAASSDMPDALINGFNKSQRLFSFINASHAFSTTLSFQHGSAKPSLKGYGGMSW